MDFEVRDDRDPNESNGAGSKYTSYIGCKIVQATPMDFEQWARSQNKWEDGQETMGPGYMVIYEDGYRSWSPKNVFDRCYREVTLAEKRML